MSANEHAIGLTAPGAARREAPRVLRFCAVGAANTVITLVVFAGLVALGCPAPAASGIGFCAGAANSFHLNRRWTFSDLSTTHRAWVRFVAIQGAGALISAGGVSAFQSAGFGHLAAECVILPCVTVALYSVSRLLVFRSASI